MDNVARHATITVAPLRLGSGTRVKILDSMAWGLPVVSTTMGVEGIDAADGQHLLVRDGAEEFAEAVVQLLTDAALWVRLRSAGGALVRERYSWDKVFAPMEDALIELIP
jgi:glycosyltransferase involved in cell wall biosynthesis